MQEATKSANDNPAELLNLYDTSQFFPRFVVRDEGCGVTVRLPNSYRKYIGMMSGNEKYRHNIEEEIAAIFKGTLRDGFEINVRWSRSGPIFDVPGNSCGVFVDGSDHDMKEYTDHNVDTAQQALVLYTCLNIHMRNTILYLGMIDRKRDTFSEPKDCGFFNTDIIFDEKGDPQIIRDYKLVEFPKKRP